MHDLSMPLWERYLMTIEEASSYFRIGKINCVKLPMNINENVSL